MAGLIMANGAGLITGVPNMKNDFKIYGIKSKAKKELYVYIAGPDGRCVPLKFVDSSDKNAITVIYKPSIEGEHKIYIRFGGIPIKGSPFKTQVRGRTPKCTLENVEPFTYPWVFPLDIYNHVISRSVAAVSASGRGLRCGLCGVDNEIVVDARTAAPGRLNFSVTGPGNVDLDNRQFKHGVYKLTYTPHSTGVYNINIKYAERPISGSPFSVTVL